LPPRFTLRIHGLDNVVSVIVLVAVALVTSRLATALQAREAEARTRAAGSEEAAAFSALLGRGEAAAAIEAALAWLGAHYGQSRILPFGGQLEDEPGFSTLDLSAAAWAMHNGDMTGHGSAVMPAADWSFLPLSPRRQQGSDILAIARPSDGTTRSEGALAQLQALAALLGQARDRIALETERRARERLEDRDALRRALLASLAHDFRTPLTVVAGELERLAVGDEGAANALAEAHRLDRMMDDLIGAARIEGGALAPRIEPVDLIDAVSDACAVLAGPLRSRALARSITADLPLVAADPILLRHILVNLLDNAARHAVSTVTIAAAPAGETVMLTVQDDGPGIPAHERARIFERFAQIEGGDRRGGSGLGLAIVRGFADAMGMAVSVDDAPEGGALFRLAMPVHRKVQ
jgi:two-component system sensor histidine kinase KdpD